MKVPLSWLKDYVDLTLPMPQLVERLTLAGLEVGGVRLVGLPPPEGLRAKSEEAGPVWDRDKVFVAQVLEVHKHPDADRLTLVTLDYGKEPKVVVTGATNLNVGDRGQKVILALSGSILYDGHAEGRVLKQLKPSKIRGVPSDAMVCSSKELGLADEHEGIILLEDDAPVGMPLADFMGDVVLEIDVLPNMARCLSMIGVAREVAALTGRTLGLPPHVMQAQGEAITGKVGIEIENPQLCARYAATLIRDIRTGPSPGWMQRRLQLAGMRPISSIVDITNYVMLEWGQPLHAFDYDKLVKRAGSKSPTIIVRSARAGEKLTTLDGVQRELAPDHLLITDTAGPIAIAGVMGGAETEVTTDTKNILLESANFNFISIRRTARSLDLPSEASYRFSRGVHPELVRPAAERAAELIRQHAHGTIAQSLVDTYPAPLAVVPIQLVMSEVQRSLGFAMPIADAARILRALEFKVDEVDASALRVTQPPHRLDLQHGPADLIEELARTYGYDRMPVSMLYEELPPQNVNRSLLLEERVRDSLVNAGLQEVMTYALTTPEREKPLLDGVRDYVRLANPISSDRIVMRQSLLASVLDITAANLRHTDDLRLFEIGHVYLPKAGQQLPEEPRRLAMLMTGSRRAEFWAEQAKRATLDFFDLKGVVETLLSDLHITKIDYRPGKAAYLHPGRSAEVLVDGQLIGSLGQLHPGLSEQLQLGRREVYVGEFDLEDLLEAVPLRYTWTPVPEYPPVRQDIAIVVEESLPAAKVEDEIRKGGGELLRAVRLFDVYHGESIGGGHKSLAYALTYQAPDRTLTDKEVAKVHGKIVSRLEKVLSAKLRA